MKIHFVKYRDIDREKWDALINQSPQALFYGLSVVYDTMCDKWNALVLNDYEVVMPLPFKNKFKIVPYIYQPFFVQQSGVFAKEKVNNELLEKFIKRIPSYFLKVNTHLNYGNEYSESMLSIKANRRKSFEIDLNKSYETLRSNYNKDCLKNLKKLEDPEIRITNTIETSQVVEVYKEAYGNLNKTITNDIYQRFELLVEKLENQNMVDKQAIFYKNNLLACGVFIKAFGRIHYCLGAPTIEGRKWSATHLLIDSIIKKYSNQPMFFDFEGSEIPNVASFYKKFGPKERTFFTIAKSGV